MNPDFEVERLLKEWRKCRAAGHHERAAYIANDLMDAIILLRRFSHNELDADKESSSFLVGGP